jgi:site-specific DNA-methyltransferase (adenine-specific)
VTAPYWASGEGDVTVYLGKCEAVLPGLPACSVDAVVTDPPYGLEFMGKDWDAPWTESGINRDAGFGAINMADGAKRLPRPSFTGSTNPNCLNCGGKRRGRRDGTALVAVCVCDDPQFPNVRAVEMRAFQAWCEAWATECLRVLKPGGYMLAFGGTRTWHRLACGVEDAGFEIRDGVPDLTGQDAPGLLWIHGQGFPKSVDMGRAIDMHMCQLPGRHCMRRLPDEPLPDDHVCPESAESEPWRGWGTALKPAWEPVVVARKPLAGGSVAAGVLEWGTGALNIDGCRVAHLNGENPSAARRAGASPGRETGTWGNDRRSPETYAAERPGEAEGRWPANVVFTHDARCEPACVPGCPVAELDRQSGVRPGFTSQRDLSSSSGTKDVYGENVSVRRAGDFREGYNDMGGASRFFPVFRYQAKAPASERPRLEDGTGHETVKPLELIRWLCRLITPPGGTVLDLFAGSGPVGEACVIEGFRCVLIDEDPKSAGLMRKRLGKPIQPVMFGLEA